MMCAASVDRQNCTSAGRSPLLSPADVAIWGALALILFGPEQFPKVARKAGSLVRDLQNTSQSFIREMERAADDIDLRAHRESTSEPAPVEAESPAGAESPDEAESPVESPPATAAEAPAEAPTATADGAERAAEIPPYKD